MFILQVFNDIGMINDVQYAQIAFRVKKTAVVGAIRGRFLATLRDIFSMNGRNVDILLPSRALS